MSLKSSDLKKAYADQNKLSDVENLASIRMDRKVRDSVKNRSDAEELFPLQRKIASQFNRLFALKCPNIS